MISLVLNIDIPVGRSHNPSGIPDSIIKHTMMLIEPVGGAQELGKSLKLGDVKSIGIRIAVAGHLSKQGYEVSQAPFVMVCQ